MYTHTVKKQPETQQNTSNVLDDQVLATEPNLLLLDFPTQYSNTKKLKSSLGHYRGFLRNDKVVNTLDITLCDLIDHNDLFNNLDL